MGDVAPTLSRIVELAYAWWESVNCCFFRHFFLAYLSSLGERHLLEFLRSLDYCLRKGDAYFLVEFLLYVCSYFFCEQARCFVFCHVDLSAEHGSVYEFP